MNVRVVLGGIVVIASIAGAALYYLQIHASYDPVAATDLEDVALTSIISGESEAIIAQNVTAIEGEDNPIRYRACFDSVQSLSMLTETYQLYDDAEPLMAPPWFDCFDAKKLGGELETGEAIAFLGIKNIAYGVDRVVAVDGVGRGYVWHQLNHCGAAVYAGDPAPQDCPPPPEKVE